MDTQRAARLPDYVIVSPVKDEAEFLDRTAASIAGQLHRPLRWVIVDDGSTDATADVAERWSDQHPWIELVRRPPSTRRARGAPIVRAFRDGASRVDGVGEFVVKLDGDLYLPPHYFAWVAATFRDDAHAGLVGGVVFNDAGWRWVPDTVHHDSVHGVAKAYRWSCLADIGGLQPSMGWDGIDEVAARARGWHVRVLSELMILHFKPRGSKQQWWRARWEEGRGNQFMGYRPDFMLLRAGYRMLVERPRVLGGLVMAASYTWHVARRCPRVADERAVAQLRREQRARLRSLVGRRHHRQALPTRMGPAHRHDDCLEGRMSAPESAANAWPDRNEAPASIEEKVEAN